jgi:hypothetical protein
MYIKLLFAPPACCHHLPPSFCIIAAVNSLPLSLMMIPVPRSTRARTVIELPKTGNPVYLHNMNSLGLFQKTLSFRVLPLFPVQYQVNLLIALKQ